MLCIRRRLASHGWPEWASSRCASGAPKTRFFSSRQESSAGSTILRQQHL